MKKATFRRIAFKDFLNCFSNKREYKYHYLGAHWNIFNKENDIQNHLIIEDFIKFVDNYVKPKWCPRFLLNLLHLFGNDNSIIRVRNWRLSNFKNYLTDNIMITDIKIKYGTIRIYGYFPEEIETEIRRIEKLIDPTLEAY